MSSKAVRNRNGIWINTELFREEALYFQKHGYYNNDLPNSPNWFAYWTEQRRRCIEGYEVGGVKITGDHYAYLNFCPILKSEDSGSRITKKVRDFPDFWDGDYEYYWCREIARNGAAMPLLSVEDYQKYLKKADKQKEEINIKLYNSLMLDSKIRDEALNGGYNMIVGKSRRKGYEQPNSEIVMIPNGYTTMGSLKIGDEVLTPTGKAKILEYYPQGKKDVYEITLQDGRKVKCGLNHLWNIIEFRGQTKTVNTKFFLDKKLKRGSKGKEYYSYYLPQTNEVEYNLKNELPVNPYLLGLLIGDGSYTKGSCLFSTIDLELLDYIKEILGFDYEIRQKTESQYSIIYNKNYTNPLSQKLKELNLKCVAKNKFIPEIYKYASIEERYELVRGLMDTDGSVWKNGCCNFVNTSEQLIDDLAFVLRGLGIRVKKLYNGINKGFSINPSWTLIITTDKKIFKLKRKKEKLRERKYNINKIAITNIEKLNYQEESSCILIDSQDHLYLTKDFIVTHNSYKNAAIGANNYFHSPERITLYTAYEKRFLYPSKTAIFTMCASYINFINSNTAWAMPSDYINKQEHIKASYKQYKDGIEIEKGFKSEVQAISFKDNADALRGKDAYDIIIEEAGAFGTPGLLKSCYMASEDCVKDGINKTGMITIFGTSGDMEGGTADYAEMFQNPERFELLPFENIFEEKTKSSIGFFHPVNWNMPGFYDKQGNSDKKSAENIILKEREDAIDKGATPTHLNSKMQEKPIVPSEAFGVTGSNLFPIAELKIQRDRVINEKLNTLQGKNCTLEYNSTTKSVDIKVDLSGKIKRIETMTPLDEDKGCVVIWEFPLDNAPPGLYKIGYDPVRQDKGTSLMSITVKKSVLSGSLTNDNIVAEFIGRKDNNDENHQIAEYLAMAYNTKIMYENEVPDVKVYFQRRRLLSMLSLQPDRVISKAVKKSNTSRVYGCHMTAEIKDAGERYIRDWLLSVIDFDEDNKPIYRLNKIYSVRLLTELIEYDRKKATKFDYISSLIMCLIQEQEEVLNKEYSDKKQNSKVQQFIDSYKNRVTA